MFKTIISWFSGSGVDDEVYDDPKHRDETETMDLEREFSKFEVTIDYGDRESTKYATEVIFKDGYVRLHTEEPYIERFSPDPYNNDFVPPIEVKKNSPFIVSLYNIESIDMEKVDDFVHVAKDVEYEQKYVQYREDGVWHERGKAFYVKEGGYDIEKMRKSEWEKMDGTQD